MKNREKLKEWLNNNNYAPKSFSQESGVPRRIIYHYLYDKSTDINPRNMKPEYRQRLYKLTRLDFLKTTPQMIAGQGVDISKLFSWQRDLLNWMAENCYNQGMLRRETGIAQGCINSYCNSPTLKLCKKNRKALYRLTQLESLHGRRMLSKEKSRAPSQYDSNGIETLVSEVKNLAEYVRDRLPLAVRPETDTELVQRTVVLFNIFVETLEHYKTRQSAVSKLKNAVPAQSAGYLVSCLNGLYAKDAFNTWILQQPMPVGVKK